MKGQRDADRLAVDGGPPVRDVRSRPWPTWPRNTSEQWEKAVGPALRDAYLAGTEGPGDLTESFEREFAGYCGVEHAVMTPSGTTAIAAGVAGALDLDGIEDGGEVIVPDYTYTATALAALNVGCSVAFVDIHPESFTMDPGALEAAVSDRTVAVLPVHLAGHPADMASINDVARRHGLRVIEDCAQAVGAEHQAGKVGSPGNAGAFSFQSTKNLTSGEGGAVVTNDGGLHARVLSFKDHGRSPRGERWVYPRLGWNYRPNAYAAAMLTIRIGDLEEETETRARNADSLSDELEKIEGITPPRVMHWARRHGYHLYAMLYDAETFGGKSRQHFVTALNAEGVPAVEGYTSPLSSTAGFAAAADRHPERVRAAPTLVAERIAAQGVWLLQEMLLGAREDMDDTVEAVAKIQTAFRGR